MDVLSFCEARNGFNGMMASASNAHERESIQSKFVVECSLSEVRYLLLYDKRRGYVGEGGGQATVSPRNRAM